MSTQFIVFGKELTHLGIEPQRLRVFWKVDGGLAARVVVHQRGRHEGIMRFYRVYRQGPLPKCSEETPTTSVSARQQSPAAALRPCASSNPDCRLSSLWRDFQSSFRGPF